MTIRPPNTLTYLLNAGEAATAFACPGRDASREKREAKRKKGQKEMIRNLKALGLAMAAVFAMSAVAASGASAEAPAHFLADTATDDAIFHVEQDGDTETGAQIITMDTGTIECQTVTGDGTAERTANELTLENIEYKGHQFESEACEGFFGVDLAFGFNGCNYLFHAGTWLGSGEATGTIDLVCPDGKAIVLVGPLCEFTIPPQEELSHVIYHQVDAMSDYVTVEADSAGITYEGHGFLCDTGGLKHNGTYTGNMILRAFDDEEGIAGQEVDATIVEEEA